MMKRETNENYLSYSKRITQLFEDNIIDAGQWCQAIIGNNIYSEENSRRCAKFFSQFLNCLDKENFDIEDVDKIKELTQLQENIIKERKKLQTVNQEAQEYYRTLGRNEMFNEKIVEVINKLEPIKIKHISHNYYAEEKTGLLCISDLHAGSTFEIKGIYNEVVNSYNFNIMQDRLWKLIGLVEADCIEYNNLIVAICGDVFENILRMTSLTKLKEPVIDTVINTSEFLCQWIGELQNRLEVPIRVVIIGGNHDTCSFLGSKPRFEEENLTKLVAKFMQLRFENNSCIKIDPYTDVAIVNIQGVNVMFEHGEDTNLQTTLEYFSNLYNIDIDEIVAGHFHRPESKAIGISELGDRTIYRVGSICGVGTYDKKIRKSARPSAYFALYEKDMGHTWSRNYYL